MTTDITRRVTSRVTVVSKSKDGFSTETEAQAWAQSEVKKFLEKTSPGEHEKHRSKKKEEQKSLVKKLQKENQEELQNSENVCL